MASGNFIIGRMLSLEAFDEYILSNFSKNLVVEDRYGLKGHRSDEQAVLVSIVGKGDLEKDLNVRLMTIDAQLEKEDIYNNQTNNKPMIFHSTVATKKEGIYKVLGVYKDDKTASSLFPTIAQNMNLTHVEQRAEEVEKTIRELLNTKVKDM